MAGDDGPMAALIGAVLCGGASRRMGADKATILVDGVAMARRVADALAAAGCSQSHRDRWRRACPRRASASNTVDDEFPGEGPLGGILTGAGVRITGGRRRVRPAPTFAPANTRRRWV